VSQRTRRDRAVSSEPVLPGQASGPGFTLSSRRVGALPILNRLFERMRLQGFLSDYVPRTGRESMIPVVDGIEILLRNFLLSREPLYGIGEWAAPYAPELLGLRPEQVLSLNDDRVGRCLDRLFDADRGSLVLAVVTHVISEFKLRLDELHNDSTTVSFFGRYENARSGRKRRGKETLSILFGHSKDHRPDLRQLLVILTVTADGSVPIHFNASDGNTTDDSTHQRTWDLLCELTGRKGFLYVADSKLATHENMTYVHARGGRFVSVLPRTRSEDKEFREKARQNPSPVSWKVIHEIRSEDGQVVDTFKSAGEPHLTAEGYRLLWFHSTRKQQLDQAARAAALEKGLQEFSIFQTRLRGPRTRFRDPIKVVEKVEEILGACNAVGLIRVEIKKDDESIFRQDGPGRPGKTTQYRRETRNRFDIEYEIDLQAVIAQSQTDGIFPLVTNDMTLSEKEVLLAYKRQPLIEKRFAQLKTDFEVAPVYLKDVARIEALLTIYFLALLVQALLEREVRKAMRREGLPSIPIYPEGRDCKAPSARRILDLFENVQRHELIAKRDERPAILNTELSATQKQILRLTGMPMTAYAE
jgi:transposase